MGLDVDRLLNALENENNESLLDLNKEKISTMKNDILQKLNIKNDKLKLFHKKLKLYRYVDNVEDINYGSFIRWISLKTPNDIKLTNGGIVCDSIGVHLKLPRRGRDKHNNRKIAFNSIVVYLKSPRRRREQT